jgi:hypothetical protein
MTGRSILGKEGWYLINRSLVGRQRLSGYSGKDLNFLASTGTQTINYKDPCLVTMPIILSPNTTFLDSELPQISDSVYTFYLPQNLLIKNRKFECFYGTSANMKKCYIVLVDIDYNFDGACNHQCGSHRRLSTSFIVVQNLYSEQVFN